MSQNKELSTKEQLNYVILGFAIAMVYVGLFMMVTDNVFPEILPEADAQILPFEQQLEQIRNPKECTRKVVQGTSAGVPFTMKVFYDTTRDTSLEFKQQGTSFPIIQRTNQVMTFFTEEPDQYEIFLEMNYDTAEERQIYIEFLSNNAITQSTQEKFDGNKYCATIFVNTVKPTPVPTKEEIFGESLEYIKQIPAMVTAFNANSQTSATSIAWQWILLFAVLILSIWTLISNYAGKRGFDSKMRDLDDSIVEVNKMAQSMDNLVRNITDPLREIKEALLVILNLPQIQEKIPKKESKLKKIISFRAKKKEPEKPKSARDEVLEALQPTEEELKEEKPSGGFVIDETLEEPEEEKVPSPAPLPPKEENPMNLQPKIFNVIMREIDFQNARLKKGALDKFTYTELNESFGWISEYRKWAENEDINIPNDIKIKQKVAEEVIYHAIFEKIDERGKI